MSRSCPACKGDKSQLFAEKNGYAIVRCRRCASLYTPEFASKDYDAGYAREIEPPPFLRQRMDEIVSRFEGFKRTGRLLDVGFGAGDILGAASRAGWQVSGVELARAAVDRAREQGVDAFHGRLSEAPFEAESFDMIVAAELVEHVFDVEPLLAGIRRLLRPGGALWATTPHARGLSARILRGGWSVVNPPNHVKLFSAGGMRMLLHRAGFSRVSIRSEGVNPHEILQGLRGRRIAPGRRIDAAYAVNAFFEESSGRRAMKRTINAVLSAARLGDSLKFFAYA